MLNFALIGCGRITIRHAENIKRVGKLVAVFDLDRQKAETLANTCQARVFNSLSELLQSNLQIDVVVVCTPNGYHAEQCIQALESGRNVLCEKPLCLTTEDALKIIEAEKKNNKKLFVVKSMRFNPLLQNLKRLISEGELGLIYSFQLNCFWSRSNEYYKGWHGKKFPDGGTLFTQFSHYIDAILWLFGDIKNACGFATNAAHKTVMEFEDSGIASLQFENGVLGCMNWSVNSYQKNFEISLTVIAEKGTISIGGEFLNELKYEHTACAGKLNTSAYHPDRSTLSHHREVYDSLILSLHNAEHEFTNAVDGMKTVEAIESIYKSVSYL